MLSNLTDKTVIATSSDSLDFNFKGGNEISTLGAPGNISLSDDAVGEITWTAPADSIGTFLYYQPIAADVTMGYATEDTSDFGRGTAFYATDGDMNISLYSVDIDGNYSAATTVKYSDLLKANAPAVTAELSYDEATHTLRGTASSNENYYVLTVNADGTELYEVTGVISEGAEFSFDLHEALLRNNLNSYLDNEGSIITGDIELTLEAYYTSDDYQNRDSITADELSVTCNADFNSQLAAPENLRMPEDKTVVWDEVNGAVSYVMCHSGGVDVFNFTNMNSCDTWMDNSGWIGSFDYVVAAVDSNGNFGNLSDKIRVTVWSEDRAPTTWDSNIACDNEIGTLTWDYNMDFVDPTDYNTYYGKFDIFTESGYCFTNACGWNWAEFDEEGNVKYSAQTLVSVNLPVEFARANIERDVIVGNQKIRLHVLGWDWWIVESLSTDSISYSYDGCDLNNSLGAPSSMTINEKGEFIWSEADDAVGYLVKISDSDDTIYLAAYSNMLSDFASKISDNGFSTDTAKISLCSVDINGDVSAFTEPVTYQQLCDSVLEVNGSYNWTYDGTPIAITITENADGTFSDSYVAALFMPDGCTKNETTIEEMMDMYEGIVVNDFVISKTSHEKLSASDIGYNVFLMSIGDTSSAPHWDAVYNTNIFNFEDTITADRSNVLDNIGIGLYISSDVLEAAGVKNGEIVILNPVNVSAENNTITWDAIDSAESYIVKTSNGTVTKTLNRTVNNCTIDFFWLREFKTGTYRFYIYSVDADGNEKLIGFIDHKYTSLYSPLEDDVKNTFTYIDNADGTITITGGNIVKGNVIIPAEIDGKKVTAIGDNAFSAFDNSTAVNIKTLVIPEGVKKLGYYCFNTCENLTEVTLPESLEYIDSWAFERCYALKTINIPANVKTINGNPFAQNTSMTSITCDSSNTAFVSVNGVLFTKGMDALVSYPAGIKGAYTVPASVNHIGDAAFYGAKYLDEVNILGTLDFIGFEAFGDCELLTDVKINDGVNYVGYYAFKGCKNIRQLTVPQSVTNIGDCAFGYQGIQMDKYSDFTLRGYKDSAVYFYAVRHEIPFICMGEADPENMPFDEELNKEEEIITNPDPTIPEDDRITTIVYNPGFNMKDKSEAGVGLDVSIIKVKAKEIYDEEGLKRAEEALGIDIVGKKHYNLLDLTLMCGDRDISNGYDGLVEVVIPIPKGHREKEFYCYRLLEDGTKEIIPGVRRDDAYVIYLEHFSVYALVADEEHKCDFSENWSNDKDNHWHECSCGEKTETAAHISSDWIIEIEATRTEKGRKYKDCTVCGYILETAEIPVISGGGSTGGGSGSSTGGSGGGSSRPSATTSNPTVNGTSKTWSEIASDISRNGTDITVQLNGCSSVPADVIKAIADKDITVTFVIDSVRSWVVDGADISASAAADLSVIRLASLRTDALRGVEGTQLRINDTNAPTKLVITFKSEHAGKFANLYKSVDGKLVFVDNVKVDADGKAAIPASAKGDYAVMLSEYSDRIGDANNDGVTNAMDAAAVLKDIVGIEEAVNSEMCDFNGDGKINATDAADILKAIVNAA